MSGYLRQIVSRINGSCHHFSISPSVHNALWTNTEELSPEQTKGEETISDNVLRNQRKEEGTSYLVPPPESAIPHLNENAKGKTDHIKENDAISVSHEKVSDSPAVVLDRMNTIQVNTSVGNIERKDTTPPEVRTFQQLKGFDYDKSNLIQKHSFNEHEEVTQRTLEKSTQDTQETRRSLDDRDNADRSISIVTEIVPTLSPVALQETTRHQSITREEVKATNKLIIEQMKVEVVAQAPSPRHERRHGHDGSSMTKTEPSDQKGRLRSPLRFGLGQM